MSRPSPVDFDHLVPDVVYVVGVVAPAARHGIGIGPPVERIVVVAALKIVLSGTAVKRVVAGTPLQGIVSVEPVQGIVAADSPG